MAFFPEDWGTGSMLTTISPTSRQYLNPTRLHFQLYSTQLETWKHYLSTFFVIWSDEDRVTSRQTKAPSIYQQLTTTNIFHFHPFPLKRALCTPTAQADPKSSRVPVEYNASQALLTAQQQSL